MPERDDFLAYQAKAHSIIAEHGVMVQGVFSGVLSDDDTPGFHYTVGLTRLGHPELFVIGLPMDVGHYVVNTIAQRILAGELIVPGDRPSELLAGGYEVEVVDAVEDPRWPLNIVRQLYHREPVGAWQVVYQDLEHRFPWDDGYTIYRSQPLLGERTIA